MTAADLRRVYEFLEDTLRGAGGVCPECDADLAPPDADGQEVLTLVREAWLRKSREEAA